MHVCVLTKAMLESQRDISVEKATNTFFEVGSSLKELVVSLYFLYASYYAHLNSAQAQIILHTFCD